MVRFTQYKKWRQVSFFGSVPAVSWEWDDVCEDTAEVVDTIMQHGRIEASTIGAISDITAWTDPVPCYLPRSVDAIGEPSDRYKKRHYRTQAEIEQEKYEAEERARLFKRQQESDAQWDDAEAARRAQWKVLIIEKLRAVQAAGNRQIHVSELMDAIGCSSVEQMQQCVIELGLRWRP